MKHLVALLAFRALAACDAPPFTLVYEVSNGPGGQTCGKDVQSCSDIHLGCDAVLSLRIVSPDKPQQPHVKICQDIDLTRPDLCAIGKIDLPPGELPKETLEVQVLVWPRSAVTDPVTGELDCLRNEVMFESAFGFPILLRGEQPAFGGRTYFHPGDTETVVTLGCTYPESISAATCGGTNIVSATASVLDFETRAPVSESTGITVHLGEPAAVGELHAFDEAKAVVLPVLSLAPPPVWGITTALTLENSACTEVDDGTAQNTATLHCTNQQSLFPQPAMIDLPGVLMKRATLDQVLEALDLDMFPEEGLTIGMVVKDLDPVAGVTVSAQTELPQTQWTVQYLSQNRKTLGGTVTTPSGIFVSTDAPYGTPFCVGSVCSVGGRVKDKVTVVLLAIDSVVGQ